MAAVLACLTGFVVVAWLVIQPGVPPIDRAVTGFLHGLANPTQDALMRGATFLGSTPVLASVVALVVVVLVRRHRYRESTFLVVALLGSLVLNDALKLLVHRARPGFDWADAWPETGFPSGHTMNSFVVYVGIALIVGRVAGPRVGRVASVIAVALTVSVGISRIYLGAHWLSDVIGGYLAGASWLLLLAMGWHAVTRRQDGRSGGGATGTGDVREVRPAPGR